MPLTKMYPRKVRFLRSLPRPNLPPGKLCHSKEERLRMAKGGSPYAADGSLNHAESGVQLSHRLTYIALGDARFSTLSALVSDPPCSPGGVMGTQEELLAVLRTLLESVAH